ncbi:MAG: YqgE/AlgH family protein [Pseudomonadota bacterium]
MGDPRFAGGVVFLCAHSTDGAMGLIVNKAIPDLSLPSMLEQLGMEGEQAPDLPVCFGGPVETGRGFVLHSAEGRNSDPGPGEGMRIDDRFAMTATTDILEAIADGRGPSDVLLALGYAGWGPQQLEAEIALNGWLTCPAAPEVVFGRAMEGKWEAALACLGIDPLVLSSQAGRA